MNKGAFGLVTPSVERTVAVRTIRPADAPIDELATSLVNAEDRVAVGPNLEPKYRICSIEQPDGETLQVTVAETSWQSGAAFLRVVRDRRRVPEATHQRLLHTVLDETGWLPGLAAVHCVLLTGDRQVVATRRPGNSEFAAGRWSVSYEEQLTSVDFDGDEDPFSAAARRGYAEEFQLPGKTLGVRIIGAIVETQILNRSLLALVQTDVTAEQLNGVALDNLPEIDAISTIASTPGVLRREALRDDLHPTAPIRLEILADLIHRLNAE